MPRQWPKGARRPPPEKAKYITTGLTSILTPLGAALLLDRDGVVASKLEGFVAADELEAVLLAILGS